MAIKLFGFTLGRDASKTVPEERLQAFSIPDSEDAALVVDGPSAIGGAYGTYLDLDGTVKNEIELISKYREMSLDPEVELAVDDIINEAIVADGGDPPVAISLGNVNIPDKIKVKIREEFDTVLRLLHFNDHGYDIFKKWYIDGRIYYHAMIDIKNPREGIQELRPLDPRNIKKIREVQDKKVTTDNQVLSLPTNFTDYYLYYPDGLFAHSGGQGGLKISNDSIVYSHSGLLNTQKTMILGYLHKAIKPQNQLKMLEDASVIYRISRAPERRIFYIDVGNLPKAKAEQYVQGIMSKYQNKIIYDSATGEVRDDRKHMSMLEDFWLPRREGGRGTEISTLPGGTNLGEIEDIIYFKKKLYKSLGVPVSRLEPEGSFSLGRATEITRDEVKFGKFVNRLRLGFSTVFDEIMERQLRLKGILSDGDWESIKPYVQYSFKQDSHFAEMKQAEVLRDRVEIAQTIDEYIGRFYSTDWIRKNVLMQSEEEIFQMDKQMKREEEGGIEGGEGEEDDDTFDGGESVEHKPKTLDTIKKISLKENTNDDNDETGEVISLLKK
jgi:hypothetical protein